MILLYNKCLFYNINNSCLVEDINTKERLLCSKYNIYPLCDNYGEWVFDEIAKEYKYL